MATSIEVLHKDLTSLKKDIEFIKHILREDYELSEFAKKALKEARETPESEYIDL
ncbi:MAG: hypothetical protein KJ583_05450 [Nanoarchaeota archaeon]|nr:hypothetical protein [Nanoarchaeota archaeon]MBU1269083.1 hypothetical protein [Nanoarchaeota archaeon]MBU1604736.1 hypothetical protein [Nanoarchaeota archaeon]MBU2442988.1 hypothetical protein [Nanoarchaeota archaeon]